MNLDVGLAQAAQPGDGRAGSCGVKAGLTVTGELPP